MFNEHRSPLPDSDTISIDNQRTFIYIATLLDAIITCIDNPNTHNQTFHLSNGENLSTPALLQLLGKLTGKSSAIERLLGSLTISNQKILTTLNWQPPYTVEQGLAATAKWYLNQQKRTTN